MAILLLTTEGGQVVKLNTQTLNFKIVYQCPDDEALMGIELHNNHLYIASLSRIYKIEYSNYQLISQTQLYNPSPDFHQMQFYNNILYTTVTKRNQIWTYDEDLNVTDAHNITPPHPRKKVKYKKNYNHINNIIKHDNKFYINLNWFTDIQYASSGVVVTDVNFNEIDKFEFGWETHDFQFMNGKKIAICGSSSKRKKIHHIYKAGLMVDGELVFEHNPDESFCKGLCYDDAFIYLCGGRKMTRSKRKFSNSVIHILNKNDYSLVEKLEIEEIKAIKGGIII
jgi:hypothetical protein